MLLLSRCPPNARASKTTYLRCRRRTYLPIALRPRLIVTYILNLFMFQCMYHRERLDRARAFSPRDDEWLRGRRCRPLAPTSLGDGEATSLFIISSAGRCPAITRGHARRHSANEGNCIRAAGRGTTSGAFLPYSSPARRTDNCL